MKKILFLIVCLALARAATAQTVMTWQKTLGTAGVESCTASALSTSSGTPDGGIVMAGTSSTGYYYVIKLNADGTTAWSYSYGTGSESLYSITNTADDGFLLAGTSTSGITGDKTEINRGSSDFWIIKISSSGILLWDKTIGGTGLEGPQVVAREDHFNHIFVAGSSMSNSGIYEKTSNCLGSYDYWVVRLTKGALATSPPSYDWDKTIGTNQADIFYDMVISPGALSDNIIISGSSGGGVNGNKTQASYGNYDYWIVKVNTSGTVVWDRGVGGSGIDMAYGLLETSSGDIMVTGSSASGASGVKSSALIGVNDVWTIKLSSSGVFTSSSGQSTYGGTGADQMTKIQEISSTQFLLSGISGSAAYTFGGTVYKSAGNRGNIDFWSLTLDNNLTRLSDIGFGGSAADDNCKGWYAGSGNYFFTGTSQSGMSGDKLDASLGGPHDFWVIKLGDYVTPQTTFSGICDGGNQSITMQHGNTDGGPYTYIWKNAGGGVVSTSADFTTAPSTSTTYTLTIYYNGTALNGTTPTNTYTITTHPCCDNYDATAYSKYYLGVTNNLVLTTDKQEADMSSTQDILVPATTDIGSSNFNGWLAKFKENGNFVYGFNYDEAGGKNTYITAVKQIAGGDYILVGHSNTNAGSSNQQVCVIRVDPVYGNVIWSTYLDQNLHDVQNVSVTQLTGASNDIVISGFVVKSGVKDIIIMQLKESDGSIRSASTPIDYTFSLNGRTNPEIWDVTPTSDGGCIMAGSSGYNSTYQGALLVKCTLDVNNIIAIDWIKDYQKNCNAFIMVGGNCFSNGSQDERGVAKAYSVIEDVANNRYVVVGYVSNEDLNGLNASFKDALIFEVDYSGAVIDENRCDYGSGSGIFAEYRNITLTAHGDYLVCGSKYNTGSPDEKVLISSFTSASSSNWHNEYNSGSSRTINKANSIFELPSGDIVVAGMQKTAVGSLGETFVLRTDANGDNCAKNSVSPTETDPNLADNTQNYTAVDKASDGTSNYAELKDCEASTTAYCAPTQLIAKNNDKKDFNNIDPHKVIANTQSSAGINAATDNSKKIRLFPNPSSGLLNIDLANNSVSQMIIMDYMGRTIKTYSAVEIHPMMDVNFLSNGMYMVMFKNAAGVLATERVNIIK